MSRYVTRWVNDGSSNSVLVDTETGRDVFYDRMAPENANLVRDLVPLVDLLNRQATEIAQLKVVANRSTAVEAWGPVIDAAMDTEWPLAKTLGALVGAADLAATEVENCPDYIGEGAQAGWNILLSLEDHMVKMGLLPPDGVTK